MAGGNVVVVGAGMVGAACALALARAGRRVSLIDPGDMRRAASFGNAGHLAPEQVTPWSSWENVRSFPSRLFGLGGALDFRVRDVALWGPWSAQFLRACAPATLAQGVRALTNLLAEATPAWTSLAESVGRADIVRLDGHNIVWMSGAAADAGRRSWEGARTGSANMRAMTAAEIGAYEGAVKTPPVAGLRFSGTGQLIDPQGVREILLAAFATAGGEMIRAEVTSVEARGAVRLADETVLETDAVVVCAGVWSGRLMQRVGVRAPLIGERGYSVQSRTHGWPDNLPPTVFEERSLVVSRFTSGLRATSHLEFGAPDAPADPRKWRQIQNHLASLGIAFDAEPDRWMGPRPTLPDYLPAIGRLKRAPKIFYAFGHQHLGVTLAAITAERIAALFREDQAPDGSHPFRVERFG